MRIEQVVAEVILGIVYAAILAFFAWLSGESVPGWGYILAVWIGITVASREPRHA